MAEKKRTGTKGGKPRDEWNPTTQAFMQAVGAKINTLRTERAWTTRELGKKVSLSNAAISDIEKAKQNFPASYFPRFAEAFEVPISELIPPHT